jgi:hypothetical protein
VDGDVLTVSSVTDGSNGTVTTDGITVNYTPNTDFFGTDSFTYTVSDGDGGFDTANVSVTVNETNLAPNAVDDTATTNEDTDITVNVLSNDDDPDGHALDVTGVTQGADGSVVVNPDDTVTYSPDPNFHGSDSFTYTIDDGHGGTDTATVNVTVNPVNDAPVATDDSATTDEDVATTIDVLANDSDVDGDPLSVTAVGTPGNGTAVINPDDTITYTPNAGFSGNDSFTYTVDDGNGGTAQGLVSIEVNAASSDTPLYVYDIRFVQHDRKADWWQAVFEIRGDVDGDGNPDNDNGVAGVAITVNFAGVTFSGTTDSNGIFTTSWVKKLESGTNYYANAVDLALADYFWDPLDLDEEDDSDGDGKPDDVLNW